MEILKNPNFDFLSKARYFVVGSLILILAGVAFIARNGLRYGVEFSGGTQLILKFAAPPQVDRIRDAVGKQAPGAVIQTYGDPSKNQVLIRLAGDLKGEVENAG
jgi:preprotein translocase subunit SecF